MLKQGWSIRVRGACRGGGERGRGLVGGGRGGGGGGGAAVLIFLPD